MSDAFLSFYHDFFSYNQFTMFFLTKKKSKMHIISLGNTTCSLLLVEKSTSKFWGPKIKFLTCFHLCKYLKKNHKRNFITPFN
jgi:hypothetical protein